MDDANSPLSLHHKIERKLKILQKKHFISCSVLFLGNYLPRKRGAVNPSQEFFGGKMAQSCHISRRKRN
jgi:hypothetical protein